MEPPSAPPPPPPPLNIPPSRARRQLAARLALHSKQNALINGSSDNLDSSSSHNKGLNPFATDEDDESNSDNEEGDFTIGDLEAEEEGKGHLPPGTGLVGERESLDALDLGQSRDGEGDKNVGDPFHHRHEILPGSSVVVSSSPAPAPSKPAQGFPNMWPFGGGKWNNTQGAGAGSGGRKKIRIHETSAPADDVEQSSDDDSDDGFGLGGDGKSGRRRLSVTTEAKRRTSLEDDDEDEEVVHVALAEARDERGVVEEREEGELVEVMHAEMQGVEGGSK